MNPVRQDIKNTLREYIFAGHNFGDFCEWHTIEKIKHELFPCTLL